LSILEELKKQDLLKYLDMTAKEANGKNPLFFAIAKKYIDPGCDHYIKYALFDQKLIDFLIENASKDILLAQDKEGNNSLHIAILKRDYDNINKLIEKAKQLKCLDQLIGQKNTENLKPAQMVNKTYQDSKSIIEEIYLNEHGGIFMQEKPWSDLHHSVDNILEAKLSQYEMKEKEIITSVNHVATDSQKEITQIICGLMKSLKLSHENILEIFDLAKQYQSFTNKKIEITKQIKAKNSQVKGRVVDKMMKFSFLFQKKCKEKNILSPVNGKKVGLRTKRVFEIIDRQTLSNLLKEKQNNQQLK
jgi:hypothetical protein